MLEDRLHPLDDDEVEALEVAVDDVVGEEPSLLMTRPNLDVLHELLHEAQLVLECLLLLLRVRDHRETKITCL